MSRTFISAQFFSPAMVQKTVLENVKDVIAASSSALEAAKNEIIWILPPQMLALADQFGLTNKTKSFIEKGGHVCGITQISGAYLRFVQALLDIGENIRHVNEYQGEFMLVVDKRESISSIPQQNLDLDNISLNDQIVGFWTDDLTYADYLVTSFEAVWTTAIDANNRMREILE
jgi:hypothetical protein